MMRRITYLFLFLTCIICNAQPLSGMVVSENKLASQIGADILNAGGNAVDAAVAVGYALAVVAPWAGNIGGGGFMVIHFANGKNVFLNFRERAPLKSTPNMFLDPNGQLSDKSIRGYLAVATPGTVMGLNTALKRYGKLSRKVVMAPAIKLAMDGFKLSPFQASMFDRFRTTFLKQDNIAKIFLKNGEAYQAGDLFVQSDLAKTLQGIAKFGDPFFYQGEVAKEIVKTSQDNGGILTLQDFKSYRVQILSPISCNYKGYQVISAAPPSSGGITLCEMLNILEYFPLRQNGYQSFASTRIIIEAMRYAFADRNHLLGDPDFVKNPVAKLISKDYAKNIGIRIKNTVGNIEKRNGEVKPLTDTTHFSIIDQTGNAVAVTYTINSFFGAKVIAGNTGFFLNNEMDDFTTKQDTANKFGLVQFNKNSIAPGKRPLSSMTPTILLRNHHAQFILGSPGGPRIITTVLLTLLNVLEYDMDINRAINSPRYHYQGLPNVIDMEPTAFDEKTLQELAQAKYPVLEQKEWGAVEAIVVKNHKVMPGLDKRREDSGSASTLKVK